MKLDPAAATAATHLWECNAHGPLPLFRFSSDDLSRKRRRCKRCLADKMAAYRARLPLRHMWNRFVQRARESFGRDAVGGLCWSEHGHPLLCRLISGLARGSHVPLQCYKLAWAPSPVFDLQQVRLVKKRSRTQLQQHSEGGVEWIGAEQRPAVSAAETQRMGDP